MTAAWIEEGLSSEGYHADPAVDPSLSSSLAHLLCTRSPWHAWAAHPKLNPEWERVESDRFDVGNVVHAMLLEDVDVVHVVNAADWRTDAAKAERQEARDAGKIPLLTAQYLEVGRMISSVFAQIATHRADPPLLAKPGKSELAIIWQETNGVFCRARLDWLADDLAVVDDLKTTSRSASPDVYSRRLYEVGGDIQAAFYLRGLRRLYPDAEPVFRWIVAETSPPYAISVLTPGPDVLAVGDSKVDHALDLWKRCLDSDHWPGYPKHVVRAELPPWEEARWLERMEAIEVLEGDA